MRFFVKVKHDGQQVGVRRINDKSITKDTDSLLNALARVFGAYLNSFIVRSVRDNVRLRVVPGWSLADYGILSGHQLEIELLMLTESPLTRLQRKVDIEKAQSQDINVVCKQEMK